MLAYVVRRILIAVLILFLVSLLTFSLIHITPGDPVYIMLGLGADPDLVEKLRHELWLDRPFIVQYGHWLGNALQGDLGDSIRYNQPVSELLQVRFPKSLYLGILSLIFSIIVGILGGVISAVKRGSNADSMINVLANTGVAVPIFWFGILLIYLFGIYLDWLPISGYTSPFDDFWQSIRQAILPVISMAVVPLAILTRQTRSSMLEVISQDYVRTARAKGLRERVVMLKHALRNALIPIVTLVGLQVRWIAAGSVISETIFNIPGVGRLLVSSVLNKDFITVQGVVLVIAIAVVLTNLIVDISYGWLDPRVRYE